MLQDIQFTKIQRRIITHLKDFRMLDVWEIYISWSIRLFNIEQEL